jgi:hypothetical protein
MLTYPDVCWRMQDVCWRMQYETDSGTTWHRTTALMLTYADVCKTYADVCWRMQYETDSGTTWHTIHTATPHNPMTQKQTIVTYIRLYISVINTTHTHTHTQPHTHTHTHTHTCIYITPAQQHARQATARRACDFARAVPPSCCPYRSLQTHSTCIRQHTSAYVSIRQHKSCCPYRSLQTHSTCIRQHTLAYVSIRAVVLVIMHACECWICRASQSRASQTYIYNIYIYVRLYIYI